MKTFSVDKQRKYMRIPFKEHGRDFLGCDCGGLVWLVYKNELGIELPNWVDMYSRTTIENSDELMDTTTTMLGENGIEVDIKDAQPFDVILFNIASAPIHVGIALGNSRFMHIMQGKTTVCVERLDTFQWNKRVEGCYRHEQLI